MSGIWVKQNGQWKKASSEAASYKEPFVNGTYTASIFTSIFTVPDAIGVIKVLLYGGQGGSANSTQYGGTTDGFNGGTVEATFLVKPGETFLIQRFQGGNFGQNFYGDSGKQRYRTGFGGDAYGFGLFSGSLFTDQSKVWLCAGGSGGSGVGTQDEQTERRGKPGGGTRTSGTPFVGANATGTNGAGGGGYFGGTLNNGGRGGNGGSNVIQVPSDRNPITLQNEAGTSSSNINRILITF